MINVRGDNLKAKWEDSGVNIQDLVKVKEKKCIIIYLVNKKRQEVVVLHVCVLVIQINQKLDQ